MPHKFDNLCNSCFCKREKCATNTYIENILTKNWELFLTPIINSFIMAMRIAQSILYPDGYVYHVYINGIHEKWSKNKIVDENKPNKCDKCHKYNNIYYHLESDD